MRGLGSIPTRGNIFCFHIVKPPMPILALLSYWHYCQCCMFVKTPIDLKQKFRAKVHIAVQSSMLW